MIRCEVINSWSKEDQANFAEVPKLPIIEYHYRAD